MKATVISRISPHKFNDGRERITLEFQVTSESSHYSCLQVPNDMNLELGDEVLVEFTLTPSGADLDLHVADR